MLLCAVQQAQRLVMEGEFDPEHLGRDGMTFILSFTEFESEQALKAAICECTDNAGAVIARILTSK
jgi:hypothetical protein